MDVLSDVITVMRTGQPVSARTTWHAPWAQRLAAVVGSVGIRVDLLAAELERPRPGADVMVAALLDALLLHALRAWSECQPADATGTGWAAALGDRPTATALRAMHTDPARSWTVAALAAEAGLSRSAFARRFTALLGQPPLAYLTWWRMTRAARVLRESDAPLSTVAAGVGYASEFAFASAFKRRFGVAPGGYRRTARR